MKFRLNKKSFLILIPVLLACMYIVLNVNTVIQTKEDPLLFLYGENNSVPDASAFLFSNSLNTVKESDDINWNQIGTYTVSYKAYLGFLPIKTKKISAEILDIDAPSLKLKGSSMIYVDPGAKDCMPDYEVSDNYDPVSNIKVSLTGELDTSKKGIYKNILQACDTSGNCTSRQVIINVGNAKPDFTPGVFHLSEFDPDYQILYQSSDTVKLTDAEFDEIYWVGDSNYVNMGVYGGLNPERVIARMALGPSTWNLPMFYNNVQTYQTVDYYVKKLQPKYMIIGMGLAETGVDAEKLAKEYGKCIDDLRSIDPDIKIIISAIMPICKNIAQVNCTQEEINETNYELLRMAEEKHVRMIDSSTVLADPESGYAINMYYLEDGYHLKGLFYPVFTDFVKDTVDWKEYSHENE